MIAAQEFKYFSMKKTIAYVSYTDLLKIKKVRVAWHIIPLWC